MRSSYFELSPGWPPTSSNLSKLHPYVIMLSLPATLKTKNNFPQQEIMKSKDFRNICGGQEPFVVVEKERSLHFLNFVKVETKWMKIFCRSEIMIVLSNVPTPLSQKTR